MPWHRELDTFFIDFLISLKNHKVLRQLKAAMDQVPTTVHCGTIAWTWWACATLSVVSPDIIRGMVATIQIIAKVRTKWTTEPSRSLRWLSLKAMMNSRARAKAPKITTCIVMPRISKWYQAIAIMKKLMIKCKRWITCDLTLRSESIIKCHREIPAVMMKITVKVIAQDKASP